MSTTQPVSEREVPAQIDFPEQLPVCERRADIEAAIRDHQVVILAGETGSGKTTQLPKICLNLGRGRQLRPAPDVMLLCSRVNAASGCRKHCGHCKRYAP